ncbi:hypothetical protein [Oryzibacter oryziterrae]|uniref:hypothetical protein n=1 Tax=Oryzibacter oryziterrae TaxID=2766474 RepID=UPI001F42655A|nr:hypothetical protein [Oryzibacter oryziterrae]
MFTLVINGVAIATTDADEDEARDIFLGEDFKEDIKEFTVDGKPVWDGKSELVVRAATEDEAEIFSEIDEIEEEEDLDEEFDEDGASIMFLVDIDQFEDELDDEEGV